jgi:cobyrinic acid a,c-diamide synthase
MELKFNSPRIIISGIRPRSGKSFIALGLMLALKKRNISVSCCIHGSRIHSAVLYQRILRRYVRCVDENILSPQEIRRSIEAACVGSDLLIIDGKEGLYDGRHPGNFHSSDAELSHLTRTPVILTVDADGFTNSLGALVRGYIESAVGFDIAGTIINNVDEAGQEGSSNDELFFEEVYKLFQIPKFIGAMPKGKALAMLPKSPFSQSKNILSLPRQFYVDLTQLASRHIEVDRILEIAGAAPKLNTDIVQQMPIGRRCRIAVSEDICFNLCFHDNLELLRFYGAEIVTFSPLADATLPRRIGAVYLSGGYINDYGGELAVNESIKDALKEFSNKGGVIFSEGSGTAFLCKKFGNKDSLHNGVGIIDAEAIYKQGAFSYIECNTSDESILGQPGLIVKGVTTNEWSLGNINSSILYTLKVSKNSIDSGEEEEGFSPGPQICSTFHFFHFGSNSEIAKNIVDAAEVVCKL